MGNRKPLTFAEVEEALTSLEGWAHKDDKLVKDFTFDTFRDSIAFMVRMSFEAEERDHHPELKNIYNRVSIALATHDAGDVVTQLDLELARAIDKIS